MPAKPAALPLNCLGSRRAFVGMLAGAGVLSMLAPGKVASASAARIRAVAFDAFAIFDPRPVAALVERMFPGKGSELSALWRTRQFEYTWLRNSMGNYVDFWNVTEDALHYAAAQLQLNVIPEQSAQMLGAYLELRPWPDALPVLQALRKHNIRTALLSNLTPTMLASCVNGSKLETFFDLQLSTDGVKAFKPDPAAYRMGLKAFAMTREEIAFVAFAGWDSAGAKHFGYPTYWANRLGLPVEHLGVAPDLTHADLTRVMEFIGVEVQASAKGKTGQLNAETL